MKNLFWKRGEPFVWATGAALSFVLLMTAILLFVVLANGLAVFWPSSIDLIEHTDGGRIMGELQDTEPVPDQPGTTRSQYKIGNRDLYGLDFRWIDEASIAKRWQPENAFVLERLEYGNFYGFITDLALVDIALPAPNAPVAERLHQALAQVADRRLRIKELNKGIGRVNIRMEALHRQLNALKHKGVADTAPAVQDARAAQSSLQAEFDRLLDELSRTEKSLRANTAIFADAAGREKTIVLADIVRAFSPNTMGVWAKTRLYGARLVELFFDDPRESNTEGGLFPAIFGTVMMVILMSIMSFPLGVIAGIYLREYAKDGILVRLVRIAVNNLAGIPSIVYGIFGLGFFVYGIGASIDQVFFAERLPAPTFGTGGILWASLTLGLLTVPVVIVATEEALGAIPNGLREGSQALGATKVQTLLRILLPMASPGIMTGFILAMARAAGEVAPLMITGVVKLAPALPVDGTFPFFHLDRKFMHLGFHIYDIGFQSPNVEAAKPMVFVTTLLLLSVVILLCSSAIVLRNKMKRRYTMGSV